MSEQDKPKSSFMQELDVWTDANVIYPLFEREPSSTEWENAVTSVKKAVRTKVLESYRNGQQAGLRPAKQPQAGRRV